jgi:NADH:ubiquinone oxidoreductase subunit H
MVNMEKVTTDEVVIRRSPKYLAFMLAGIIVGVIVALVLTFAIPNTSEFTLTQIFGFLLLITGSIGGTLGLVLALVADRVLAGRTITAMAEHETVTEK